MREYLIAAAITIGLIPVAISLIYVMSDLAAAQIDSEWIARSEKVCGPGYLLFTEQTPGGRSGFFSYNPPTVYGKYCVPFKLPDYK